MLFVPSEHMGPPAALLSLPCVLQQYPSASVWGCGIGKVGQGERLFCCMHQPFSRQPPDLLMPMVDPNVELAFRYKFVLRNNCSLLNMQSIDVFRRNFAENYALESV